MTNRPEIKPACLSAGCHKPARQRGLCFTCYKTARRAIEKRHTTEEELVDLGMMAPKKRGGWKSKFLADLENRRKGRS